MRLTKEEVQLRWLLRIAAFVFSAETLVYLLPALIGSSEQTWGELPFVINSFLKAGLIGGVCFVAAADVRRFERAVSLIVVGLGLWVPGGLAVLLFGNTSKDVEVAGIELSMTLIVWGGVVIEGALALLFATFHRRALRAWHEIRYFSPGQFRTLSSVAEAMLWSSASEGPPPELTPDEVAVNADHYLAAFDAKRKWVMKVALLGINFYPLAFFKPAFTLMGVDERREFLERRFGDDVARRRIGSLRRWLVQGMVRLAQQVVTLGFYGDKRTWARVGYVPFSERPEGAKAVRKQRTDLGVERGSALGGEISAETVIVGSGAAGAVLGYRLAEAGHEVLLIERGRHIDPADFTEDEVEMLGTLYRDGALQLARDFKLQVLQGMCVGGTTVINNAVSIPPSPEVLAEWDRYTHGTLDLDRISAGVAAIKELLSITEQPDAVHTEGARMFERGIDELELRESARSFGPIEANIRECLGCGYCNIGCAYGRKLSMLDTVLPWGRGRFGDRFRIVSEAAAEGIEESGGRVSAIHCRANGSRLRVRGERFIVAAGAVNSSYLLGRSGLGGSHVGKRLSFNVGSPMTAEFDRVLNSYAGLQITHAFEPPVDGPDVLMETWFNPVVSQSLAMPGWFEQHRRNMLAYDHMAATGVLIGSEPNGRVEKALFGGADVVYTPTDADLRRLVDGLKLCARIYLAAGAKKVMPATFRYHSFSHADQVDQLDEIVRTNEDIQLGTGHPQGGNALSSDPSDGPVDARTFLVHGTENLHVCDASVFPTSVQVNPQLTTMAIAESAAAAIRERAG